MLAALVSLALIAPCAQQGTNPYFPDEPNAPTPILPATAVPKFAGGKLPAPLPHSDELVLKHAPAAGYKVVRRVLESEGFHPPRLYPLVGNARLWRLTYRYDLRDAGGNAYTIYIDRTALVLAPVKP